MSARAIKKMVVVCLLIGSTNLALSSQAAKGSKQAIQKVNKYVTPDGHFNVKKFLRDTRDEDITVRTAAFESQTRMGPKAIPDFFSYLEADSTEFPRSDSYAASALTMYGASAKPFLLNAMLKGPKLTRLIAVQAIEALLSFQQHPEHRQGPKGPGNGDDPWIYDKDIKEGLLDACDDIVPLVAGQAIKVCSDFNYKSASIAAEKLARNKSLEPAIRWMGIKALLKFDRNLDSSVDFIAGDLLTGEFSGFELYGLDRIGTDSAYNFVERVLRSNTVLHLEHSASIRGDAILVLAEFHRKSTLPTLRKYLADDDSFVRYSAANAIGVCGGEDTYDELASLEVLSSDIEIRRGAISGIAFSKSEKAYNFLCQLVDQKGELEKDAINGLGYLGDSRALKFLEPYTRDPDEIISRWAASAIKTLNDMILKAKKKND